MQDTHAHTQKLHSYRILPTKRGTLYRLSIRTVIRTVRCVVLYRCISWFMMMTMPCCETMMKNHNLPTFSYAMQYERTLSALSEYIWTNSDDIFQHFGNRLCSSLCVEYARKLHQSLCHLTCKQTWLSCSFLLLVCTLRFFQFLHFEIIQMRPSRSNQRNVITLPGYEHP